MKDFAGKAASAIAVSLGALALAASPATASSGAPGAAARQHAFNQYARTQGGAPSATHTPNDGDLADQFDAYAFERTAPAARVSAQALIAARAQAAALPTYGGAWTENTTKAYNSNPGSPYTDPFWGNQGSGFSIVGGRVTALVDTPADTWLAGTADGGVWRSTDHGTSWTPVFDSMPTLSIGSLAVNPADGSVWVGTGEANTSSDSYAGTGVYRSTDDGQTWSAVTSSDGSNPIASRTVYRIAFDGTHVFAATNDGLWRYGGDWNEVLVPSASSTHPYYDNQVTDVAIDPTISSHVIAVAGWRGPLTPNSNNGFFDSTDGGATFAKVTPTGDIDASDIGRTTFAYSADGSKLYAVVESPSKEAAGAESVLQGVFVSTSGLAGPWTKIADEAKLAASGSALPVGSGYGVGVQAWYNQDLAVDPTNPNHVYMGLEEVFETSDGGTTWDTASPYWNYGLACNSNPGGCPNVTHPDQHAMMISDGDIVIGNDGGVYSRPLTDTGYGDWSDLNAGLHNLQYYDARAGALNGGTGIWGGLQDNGTSLLDPAQSQMVEPAGGDGGDVIVNPANANQMVGEYVDMAMYSSTNGGQTFNSYVSPGCTAQAIVGLTPRHDCDPAARFIAPIVPDQTNVDHWVVGGQYVWQSTIGWKTKCETKGGCTWAKLFNTGSGHVITALSAANGAIYAAWVNGGGNPSPSFSVGIATNVGGWHQVSMAGLPNRYIAGITVDKSNGKHAIAVFNGYSRRWIPGGGVGHVFETFDGGNTWTDISGNLPDAPGDAVAIVGNRLVLATDVGTFTAQDGDGTGTSWSVLGTNLPNASVNDVTVGPDGSTVYAATHGRGVWSITP